jgi:hypothetical protein
MMTPDPDDPENHPNDSPARLPYDSSPQTLTPRAGREGGGGGSNNAPELSSAVQAASDAILPPDLVERIRQLAWARCSSLHTVEAEARETVRLRQKGARTTVRHELETDKNALKRAAKALKKAERDADAIEPKVQVPGEDRPISVLGWLLVVLSVLCLIAGVLAEQFGAAKMLQNIGAFGVETLSEALLITSTALAVGAALTFVYRHLRWRWRARVITTAALLLVGLFGLYVFNFASGVSRAEREHRQATDGLLTGASVGDGGELVEPVAAGPGPSTASDSSDAWLTFFCLLGMIPFTLVLGHAGMDHLLASFQKRVRNPELDAAMDAVALREGEFHCLEARKGELSRQLTHFEDEENAMAAAARAQFLLECARRDSRNT